MNTTTTLALPDASALDCPTALAAASHLVTTKAQQADRKYGTSRRSPVLETEDIAQESWASVVSALRGGRSIENLQAFVHPVAHRTAARAFNAAPGADQRAFRQYQSMVEALESSTGAVASTAQRQAIADQVLASWDRPKHRPLGRPELERMLKHSE